LPNPTKIRLRYFQIDLSASSAGPFNSLVSASIEPESSRLSGALVVGGRITPIRLSLGPDLPSLVWWKDGDPQH